MYSKTAGKNSKHEPADTSTNICALSKIVIQVYEHTHGRHFTSIPSATALLQVYQHVMLPPSNILTLLRSKSVSRNSTGFDLVPGDILLFTELKNSVKQIHKALKSFKKRAERDDTT